MKSFKQVFEVASVITGYVDSNVINRLLQEVGDSFGDDSLSSSNNSTIGLGNFREIYNTGYKKIYNAHLVLATYKGREHIVNNFGKVLDNLDGITDFLFSVVVDDYDASDVDKIVNIFESKERTFYFRIIVVNNRVGQVRCIEYAIRDIDANVTGYIDDDALPFNFFIYDMIERALHFGVWAGVCVWPYRAETQLEYMIGLSTRPDVVSNLTNKVMYHGGGGVIFMKTKFFNESLKLSIEKKTLLGPMMSCVMYKHGIIPFSDNNMQTKHPNRKDFKDWVYMLYKYESAWMKAYECLNNDQRKSFYRVFMENARKRENELKKELGKDYLKYRFIQKVRGLILENDIFEDNCKHANRLSYLDL